ncbi:prepilin peptidase [Streptomyces sp. G45]|uniref:prepilin peptidase n=1 Tax=Streptomyces sp. G45 TaxID=3406627 RepID=UPI003C278156
MLLLLTAVGALWGAATGLFLPRAAYRLSVPPEEPWAARCPSGAHEVTGWLGRARCADGERFGPHPLLLAAATGVACAALAAATGPRPELVAWLLLTPPGVLLAVVDMAVMRLPDVVTLPLAALAVALLGVAAALPGHAGSWPGALLGALTLSAGFFVLFLINPDGMAFGDVKLALCLGTVLGWYGWGVVLLGTFAGFVLAALYGGWLVVVRGAGRRTSIAFGPFLLAGALTGVLLGAHTA